MKGKPKKYFLIPLIIGIIMVVVGIVLIGLALTTYVPSMGGYGWFEASSARDGKIMGGAFLIAIGAFVAAGVSSIVYSGDSVVQQRRAAKMAEQKQAINSIINKFKNDSKTCPYCGSELPVNKFECPHCGAKQTKK